MNTPEELINTVKEEITNPENPEDIEKKREELLLLATNGEIKKSEACIKKANAKSILKMYSEYEAAVLEKSTVFLCDLFLSKFSEVMSILDVVEKSEEMGGELKRDPFLGKDMKFIMSYVSPIIPFIGLLSGALVVLKHVYNHKNSEENKEA